MLAWCAACVLNLVVSGGAPSTRPQDPSPAVDEETFAASVRATTVRYRNHGEAVADGYRRVGRDFPGMGEHWIHLGLVMDGLFDPDRPEVLSYARVGGEPRLLGVAYLLPLFPGEEPPEHPAGRRAWHEHTGTIDEETHAPHHHQMGHGEGPRIAMIHAWVWLPNPGGLFAADNWNLPYVRLGLEPPPDAPVPAAKALSLVNGGDTFTRDAVVQTAGLGEAGRATVDRVIGEARNRVRALLASRRPGPLGEAEVAELDRVWSDLWRSIDDAVDPRARAALGSLAVR